MSKKNFNPENKDEANFVNETAADFETKSKISNSEKADKLSEWQKKLIDKGLKDFEDGNFSSSEDVHKGARLCLK